ncbi:MAG: two-component regulator propeller domain-containing protein [Chitinophagales bacterium]
MSLYFKKLILFLVCGLVPFALCQAQERTLGTWKVFMPYGSSVGVCDAGDKVYSAASKTVFSYEKNSGVIQTFDKSTGLSDIGISNISYDPVSDVLAIAYINSNIDLIYHGTDIYNIPDIKNKATTGAVSIYSISFYNGNAYVSSSIGISVINLDRKEVSNTYIIGASGSQIKVYATAIDGVNIYAATQEGVKHASLNSSNLQNFNNWILYQWADSLPAKKASYITTLNNKVYAVIGASNCDTLYEFAGTYWQKKWFSANNLFTSLNTVGANVYFTIFNNDNTTAGVLGKIDGLGNLSVQNSQGHVRPVAWFQSNGISWEADAWNGLFKNNQGNIESVIPDGPFSSAVYKLDVKNQTLNLAPGGVDDSWGFAYNRDGFSIYTNSKWKYRNQYSDGSLSNFSDILSTVSVPSRKKTYFGSFYAGLIELDNEYGNLNLYDKDNSLLEGATGDTQRTKISAMTSDRFGNLWIGNAGATRPVKMISTDGTWREFSIPQSFSLMKRMLIDQNGQLWAPIRRSGEGILVWSNNGTPDDPSDDASRILTSGKGNGDLPDPIVYSIAEDKDGNIWAGTSQGIGVFYCPGSVLTSYGCDADQIKVERDGYIGYLFGTESVRAIAVDAANRKWIGTTNGLWLISADGKTELLKFNVDNSPLPSNQITDIAIDEETGEVFIGTLGGLVSYQGDAIAVCEDCDGALVYPNPVKPSYDGPIAIKGLADDAYVKITDISGTLVFQGKANGTQMIWDGKGYNGNRAKSGVYLVFSSTDLGKEKRVAKILIAN